MDEDACPPLAERIGGGVRMRASAASARPEALGAEAGSRAFPAGNDP